MALLIASPVETLRQENADVVFMGEHELAKAMTAHVLQRMSEAKMSVS